MFSDSAWHGLAPLHYFPINCHFANSFPKAPIFTVVCPTINNSANKSFYYKYVGYEQDLFYQNSRYLHPTLQFGLYLPYLIILPVLGLQ